MDIEEAIRLINQHARQANLGYDAHQQREQLFEQVLDAFSQDETEAEQDETD